MASISSSSSSNAFTTSYGISNKGLGGLVSGLDTDSLVAALTSATRSKIAKQGQDKQALQWKQTAYRSISSVLTTFQSKHFGLGSSSISSPSFFNSFKATSSSSKVSVATSSNSKASDITIDRVKQLATYHTMTSATTDTMGLSKELIGTEIDLSTADFTDKTISVRIDSTTKTIKLDSLNNLEHKTAEEFEEALQYLIDDAFGTKSEYVNGVETGEQLSKLNVKVIPNEGDSNKVSINLSSPDSRITITCDTEKASALGFKAEQTNRVQLSTKLSEIEGFGGKLAGDQFVVNINGAEITLSADDTINTMMSKINSSGSANVRMTYSSADDTFTLSAKVAGGGNNLDIADVQGNLFNTLFGVKGGTKVASSELATNSVQTAGAMTLSKFKESLTALRDMTITVTVGNTTRSLNLDVFDNDAYFDRFSESLKAATTDEDLKSAMESFATGFTKKLQETEAFGTDNGNIALTVVDNGGKLSFGFQSSDNTSFSVRSDASKDDLDGFKFFGYNRGQSVTNVLNTSEDKLDASLAATTLSQLGVTHEGKITITGGAEDGGNLTIEYDEDMTLKDFISASSGLVSVINGRLVIDTKNGFTDSTGDIGNFFGITPTTTGTGDDAVSTYSYAARPADKTYTEVRGQNAEIIVDGRLLSNNTNSFVFDGTTVTLNEISEADESGKYAPIKITVAANPDDVVSRVKTFIDEYNTMLTSINTMLNESKNSNYAPLTDEQRAEMSSSEIEKWENEAKKGLLRNDSTLRGIVDSMRSALYTKVESAGLTASQVGISTIAYDYTGKLKLDEDKLRTMLEKNPDAVRDLFTNSENGIATKLNSIIDKATSYSSDPLKRGSLVKLAGTSALTADSTSTITSKIATIDKYIATLKDRLESEYSRYWKRFSTLETTISQMNSQSSWLSSNA